MSFSHHSGKKWSSFNLVKQTKKIVNFIISWYITNTFYVVAEAFNLESSTPLEYISIGNHVLNSWAYWKGKYNGDMCYINMCINMKVEIRFGNGWTGTLSYQLWIFFFRFLTCCQILCLVGESFIWFFLYVYLWYFFSTKNASLP